MGLTAADTNKNISERGIILDPILQPTTVPSAVIHKLIIYKYPLSSDLQKKVMMIQLTTYA